MRRFRGFVAALAMLAPGVAAAGPIDDEDTRPPVEGVIVNPDWMLKPTGEQLADKYPETALALDVPGLAIIDCAVDSDGSVGGCRAVLESPRGFGFGAAAIALAPYFKMRPRIVDGVAVSGAHVKVPIRFMLPSRPAPAYLAPPILAARYPAPTPSAVDLARRLSAISGSPTGAPAEVMALVDSMNRVGRALPKDSKEAATEAAATKAIQDSLEASKDAFRDARAQALAQTFTVEEIKAIIAFFESPAGEAWNARRADVDALEEDRTAPLLRDAMAAAQRAACAAAGETAGPVCNR